MSFRAKTFGGPITDIVGGGPAQTFGRHTVTGKMQIFPGQPPPEMLASDTVLVETMRARPWPDSCADRKGKSPRAMYLLKADGKWPDKREQELQAFSEAKLKNPRGVGLHLLARQGIKGEEAEKALRGALYTNELPSEQELESIGKQAKTA